jgi:hypothetical protein
MTPPEEACKILQRQLRSGKRTEADSAAAMAPMWANPADKGDGWVVIPTGFKPGEKNVPILCWNGKSIIGSGLPPVSPEPERVRTRAGTERRKN